MCVVLLVHDTRLTHILANCDPLVLCPRLTARPHIHGFIKAHFNYLVNLIMEVGFTLTGCSGLTPGSDKLYAKEFNKYVKNKRSE